MLMKDDGTQTLYTIFFTRNEKKMLQYIEIDMTNH